MFPTYISILDIQSWWEVPSIAHFCSLFRTAFNLLDFDIEDLEEALLTDGTEESSWLQELIVKLLRGCLPNNEISTFNYQMFLRRLFREKCKEHDRYNPFNTDIDFQLLPLRTKVDILHALCDFRLDADDVLEQLKNLEADSLRVEPLGYDNNDSAYWYFYGTRLYREDFKTKNNKKGKSVWQVVCFTEDDWFQLAKKFKKAQSKAERQLYRTLTENFLPELPRLFCEKERLARKRLLENQPRRTSSRLDIKRKQELVEQAEKAKQEPPLSEKEKEAEEELRKKKELEQRRQEAYERRARLREQTRKSEESETETRPKGRYEMAGNKKREKKVKAKPRQDSPSSSSSRDRGPSITRSSNRSATRAGSVNAEKANASNAAAKSNVTVTSTTVGRQTNNSLACATGQIVIQPVSNPHRKKLKTSQVFCQTDEDLQTGMHKILDYVKNHKDAWPFVDPVEEEFAPNYYSIIRKPMDLQRMEERLDSGYYKSFLRFRSDFQLIVDNCRLYNGVDNEYTEMVGNLLNVFEKATERYLDQVTSSDEEIAVEYLVEEKEEKPSKQKKGPGSSASSSTRKSVAASTTDKKSESVSEDASDKKGAVSDHSEDMQTDKKTTKRKNVEDGKTNKKNIKVASNVEEKQTKKKNRKNCKPGRKPVKKEKSSPSPARGRSCSRSSSVSWSSDNPPPSWPPSSPESLPAITKGKHATNSYTSDEESVNKFKGKDKPKDKRKDVPKEEPDKSTDKKHSVVKERSPSPPPPKQKDKHNKLRETIEKLKAKSEISKKLMDLDYQDLDADKAKENRVSPKEECDHKMKNVDSHKDAVKSKIKRNKNDKKLDFDDENSTVDSIQSDNKKQVKKENPKNCGTRNAAIEALTLATEQTLKDINKWLDDTPRLSEFSSASNSPSHYIGVEEFDSIGNKIEQDYRKRLDKQPLSAKKDFGKDVKRRSFHRDPTKFLKKREVQRTIDRLQPGKSKGNLLSNIQNANKSDDLYPLGPLSKIKDTKNSLIVKTDESTPKLSLGSVLDSFGKHKFVDDVKKEEGANADSPLKKESDAFTSKLGNLENLKKEPLDNKTPQGEKKDGCGDSEIKIPISESGPGKATPNLSAWFKAFGAPKVPPSQKKNESKVDAKEAEKAEENSSKQPLALEQKLKEENRKVAVPEVSPNPDSPAASHGQPTQRQRKMSTGSTVSERSSFSQDMDSPRIGIDERLGAYPAPYPSPLHRSPSGASPVMASPRPDVSPKSAYPTVNGQIRVGFYQDTVSTKSSPDKSCSPRDNPQSPYPQYSEHVYTPSTTESVNYSYNNPSYYSQMGAYSNPTTPSYNSEQSNQTSYYDTNKPLTDQYQAKTSGSYPINSPNYQNVNSPNYPPNSPNYHSPVANSPVSSIVQIPPSPASATYDLFRQQQTRALEKQQTTMFPVKKRAYNESETPQLPNASQPQEQQGIFDRNYELDLIASRQLAATNASQPVQPQEPTRSRSQDPPPQQYVHQNIPNPRVSSSQNVQAVQSNGVPGAAIRQTNQESNNFGNTPSPNLYNYSTTEPSYQSPNASSDSPLDLNARPDANKKAEIEKFANMNYANSDIGFARNTSSYDRVDLNFPRTMASSVPTKTNGLQATSSTNSQNIQNNEVLMHYSDSSSVSNSFREGDVNSSNVQSEKVAQVSSLNVPQTTESRLNTSLDTLGSYKPPEMSIPRPGYSTAVDQSLGSLRGNLTNLSHIVDRFSTENIYYSDKALPSPHIYSKATVTSAQNLPMFSQSGVSMSYGHEMQATQSPIYSRQITDLQNSICNQSKVASFSQQQQQDKKSKRRKGAKTSTPAVTSAETSTSSVSGFQSYTGLKSGSGMEPGAISLKTTSVVPGSAFNFGPSPTGLGLSTGLYGDKDTYPNFLDDYRAAPNYYMAAAAAAAHHRSTPDAGDKPVRAAHQPSSATAGYPFIGAPQPRPPSYPLSGPFMPSHQAAPLMDASSPLYQQYLQAGVLHQGLLGPASAYPPGYHPALSMRQPFDSMTRPSWL